MVTFSSAYTVGIDRFLTFVRGVGYVPPDGEVRDVYLTTVSGSGTYQVSLDGATGTVTLSGALDR